MSSPHISILLNEFLAFFAEKKIVSFVDGTLGAGGHAKALLEAHPEIDCFFGFDKDPEALEIARENLLPFSSKVRLIQGSFQEISNYIQTPIDGMFLDLGVSSMQLDRPEKGFSFSKEGPLDMRMDPSLALDAATVVNTFPENKLETIFRELGEERKAKLVAKAIVSARKKKKIKTTLELCEVLKPILTWSGRHGKKIHPMTLVFQALRIYVNDELGSLERTLPEAISLLAPQGRLGVISFHSLEDRIVKNIFRDYSHEKKVQLLTKKALFASDEEVKKNPRSRSARMRFIEKVA